jgi:hypothetical protein
MIKKLSLLLAAVAVLAFAVPAMASAHKVTSKAGTLAAVGTIITGTGSDVTLTSSLLGPITCGTLTLTGELTVNDGTNVTGKGTTNNPPSTDCTNEGQPVVVTSVAISSLKAEGTETNVSFVATVDINSPKPVECTFTGVKVPFTYTVGGDSIVFTKAAGITSTGGCGPATLDGSFTIEIIKEGVSTPVILD